MDALRKLVDVSYEDFRSWLRVTHPDRLYLLGNFEKLVKTNRARTLGQAERREAECDTKVGCEI